MDFKDQKRFNELIGELNRETGVTVVLVSHQLEIVKRFAYQVICLKDGLVASQGPPLTVLTPAAVEATFGHQMPASFLPRHE